MCKLFFALLTLEAVKIRHLFAYIPMGEIFDKWFQAVYKDLFFKVSVVHYCVSSLSGETSAMTTYSTRSLGYSHVVLLFISHLGSESMVGV